VVYEDAWPGVDVRYRFDGDRLKYDLLLDAGADPSAVLFRVEGAEGLDVAGDVLSVRLSGGTSLEDRDLVAWYADGGPVDAAFRPEGGGAFGFDVDAEPGRPLVIDPVVVHSSTYIGGSYYDYPEEVAVDRAGNIYVAGLTGSPDYPVTAGAYDRKYDEGDVFVTKLNHNCSRVLWSTYLGGTNYDYGPTMAVDEAGSVYLTGTTWSKDFPITKGAYQTELNNGFGNNVDVFVTKLSSLGNALVYSTFIGGSGPESSYDLAVHDRRVAIAMMTDSLDFRTKHGMHAANFFAAVLVILNTNGSDMDTCKVWDGIGGEAAKAVTFYPDGDVLVGGQTGSPEFPVTPGVYQQSKIGQAVGFVCHYDVEEDRQVMATFIGRNVDEVLSVDLDDEGYIYLGGRAQYGGGVGFPTTEGAHDTVPNGWYDGFATKMDPDGTRLVYSTLVGGEGRDVVTDVAVDPLGRLAVVGYVESGDNFTVTSGCHDANFSGDGEGFVRIFNKDGSDVFYSSFHGGKYDDEANAVALDPADNLVVVGRTLSTDFPVSEDGYSTRRSGQEDGYVSVIGEYLPTTAPLDLTARGREGFIELDWDDPVDLGGYPIRNYLLYRGTTEGDLRLYKVLDPVNVYVDGDVEWGVTYHYAVIADNWKGRSPMSNVASAVSVTVPDPPRGLTGTVTLEGVTLEWDEPAFTGGLPLTGYIIYRIAQDDHMELVIPLEAGLTSFDDGQVRDGTVYTYTMTALNGHGESREFVSVTVRTFGAPTPPQALSHTYGDLFVRLRWEAPLDDMGLPVTEYTVHRRTSDSPFEEVGRVTAPVTTFLDDDVEVGVTYHYHVLAVNAKGPSGPSVGIEVMPRVPPGPPLLLEAKAHGEFVRLTWSPPSFDGASPVTGYRVYLGSTMGSAVSLGGINVLNGGSVDLVFLHDVAYDGTSRTYIVTAINAEGESSPSEPASTRRYLVPSAPLAPTIEWGDGQLALEWLPPTEDGGTPVLYYSVHRRAADEDGFSALVTVGLHLLRFVDDATENGVEYTYRITAWNLVGEGLPSEEVTSVPAGLPGAPIEVEGQGGNMSASLSWRPPPWSGGRPVTGYRLYAIVDGNAPQLLVELGPSILGHEVGDLENGGLYLFALRAVTEVGESVLSDIAEARPVGPPGAPKGLVAFWVDGAVQLTWASPSEDGGSPVLGYRLRRAGGDAGNWTEVLALTFRDATARPGDTFDYTIVAFNAAGTGPAVSISFTAPPEEVPDPQERTVGPWPYLLMVLIAAALIIALVQTKRQRGPRSEVGKGSD